MYTDYANAMKYFLEFAELYSQLSAEEQQKILKEHYCTATCGIETIEDALEVGSETCIKCCVIHKNDDEGDTWPISG